MRADVDGDGLFDDLERRLAPKSAADRVDVIVQLRDAASAERVRGLERAVGSFDTKRRFTIVPAFAARASKRQIEALARDPRVAHVEEDSIATKANDAAQAAFGVAKARIDAPGLDGSADGNVDSYSTTDLVAAVIDTGIDANHIDLDEGKVLAFRDFVNNAVDSLRRRRPRHACLGHDRGGGGRASWTACYKGVAPGAGAGRGQGARRERQRLDLQHHRRHQLGGRPTGRCTGSRRSACRCGIARLLERHRRHLDRRSTTPRPPGWSWSSAARQRGAGHLHDRLSLRGDGRADRRRDGGLRTPTASPGVLLEPRTDARRADQARRLGAGRGDHLGRRRHHQRLRDLDGTSMATPFVAGVALLMLDRTRR